MIQPPGFRGAAFTTASDGDMHSGDRSIISNCLGISSTWATVRQIHGARLIEASEPGDQGEADGLVTVVTGLPLAVMTADCSGVILEATLATAVVHAGWRGAVARTAERAAERLDEYGGVQRAAIGPVIGPCCFEVGDSVAKEFPDHQATTTWGTTSVDLRTAIQAQVPGIAWWVSSECTRCGEDSFSHRRDATPKRMAAIGWMP